MMDANITGLSELRINFEKIAVDMQRKSSARIVVAGGKVLRTEAKRLAQAQGLRKTGALIKNIVIKKEKTPIGIAQVNLGVRHGRALGNGKKVVKYLARSKNTGRVITKRANDPFYWSFLEFGRNTYKGIKNSAGLARKTKNSFASGRVKARPFIAPALVNKRAQAIAAMAYEVTKLTKAGVK